MHAGPPPYTLLDLGQHDLRNVDHDDEKTTVDGTLHFLNHDHDNITSLSFRYGVPAAALRRANNITSDHLLQGRKTILIPGEYYKGGLSLSPTPIDGEDEELRKSKIRRFMTSCKVFDYNVAQLYLEQSGYDLSASVQAYYSDENWERGQLRNKAKQAAARTRGQGLFWRT
ncbi:hypothetical protein ED733_003132 [Metarhizium rileyi]|uniref:LysM domain-containing protein n=1 Tax=Metarhizium rileyi (strain RCEF 4871) TaxID=1649241 RepID=A0A5C6G992_METRR|nr:hypothetical protein ED733_003132 [Metarhizium rileyi]